jgi:hypothetical protein
VALVERQLQLWTTPHGSSRAALANNATVQGRAIAFAVPGRYTVKATLDGNNLVEKVEAMLSNPVVGDMPMEVVYADYRDFGGVKVPTRIRQAGGGFPAVDLTVSDAKPNAAVDIQVPDSIRQATMPYARVASEQAADGVWYVAGGSHHSVVIEMKDHIIVVEGPLNDERNGGDRGSAPARARQADPLRHQQSPPLLSRGRAPGLRGGRHPGDHARVESRVLRERADGARHHDSGQAAGRAAQGRSGGRSG